MAEVTWYTNVRNCVAGSRSTWLLNVASNEPVTVASVNVDPGGGVYVSVIGRVSLATTSPVGATNVVPSVVPFPPTVTGTASRLADVETATIAAAARMLNLRMRVLGMMVSSIQTKWFMRETSRALGSHVRHVT